MRVALVCPYAWDRDGGVQTHVRALAHVLRRRGHDVHVVAPRAGWGPEPDEPGVTFVGRAVAVPANGSVATLAFGPAAGAGVRRVLRALDPDVVHAHEPLVPSLSLLALLGCDAPAVGTFHAAADDSAGYRLARPVLERALRRLSVRTAVSDAARDLVARYFPGDYLPTPNGVDTARFAAAEPLDLGPGRKVLFLGRIERRKGLDVLVRSFARAGLDAELVVAGSGPEEASCRRLAASLGVCARWLGRLDDDDVARAYRAADVYCAPNLGGESFGIVLVEAMAAGAPLVCSDLPGFRAVAQGAARLVPPEDADALAAALAAVLSDGAVAARMAARGSERAAAYDWDRLAGGVEAAYERAVAAAARPR
ncbi:MAG TPA: glycosyltransferase family 4 protein [Actinomycetota bacterium]|nr:glycosyltransferase family 4 protein [Actinomycetota bacterium]